MPVKTLNLENGLQVILVPRHETPIIYSLVRYKVGSANETTGITGISHMLEHMMFKGTKEFQTLNYDMEVPIMEKQDEYFAEVRRLRQLKVLGRAPEDADNQIEILLLKIKGLNVTQKILTIQNDVDVATFQVGSPGSAPTPASTGPTTSSSSPPTASRPGPISNRPG